MKSRADYLNGKCSHREYYGQFVTAEHKEILLRYISIEELRKSRADSFNDISLKHWDILPILNGTNAKMKKAGDYITLAGSVCIWKETARQILEGGK